MPWKTLLVMVGIGFGSVPISDDFVMLGCAVVMMFLVVGMGLTWAEANLREIAKSLNDSYAFASWKSSVFGTLPWFIVASVIGLMGNFTFEGVLLVISSLFATAAIGMALDAIATDLAVIAKALNKDANTTLEQEQPSAIENIQRLRKFMSDDWK